MTTVSSKQHSSQEIHTICSDISRLGRTNHEWLDVRRGYPIAKQKSRSFCSRFWKPNHLRLIPAFNKTVEFFKANKEKLMDPLYVEKNIEALEHLYVFFSSKKHPKLHLWTLQLLIEEVHKREQPSFQDSSESILRQAKEKSEIIVNVAQQKYDLSMKLCTENEKSAQAELYEYIRTINQNVEAISMELARFSLNFSAIRHTRTFLGARNKVWHLHSKDAIQLTCKGKPIAIHSFFLKSVIKDPAKVIGQVDIFKEHSEKIILTFRAKVYRMPFTLARQFSLYDYLEYIKLLFHPDLKPDVEEIYHVINGFKAAVGGCNYPMILFYLFSRLSYLKGIEDKTKLDLLKYVKGRIEQLVPKLSDRVDLFNRIAVSNVPKKVKLAFLISLIEKKEIPKISKEVEKTAFEEFKKHLFEMQKDHARLEWFHYALTDIVDERYISFFEKAELDDNDEFQCKIRFRIAECYAHGIVCEKNYARCIEICRSFINNYRPSITEQAKELIKQIPIEYFNEGANRGNLDDIMYIAEYFLANPSQAKHLISEKTIEVLVKFSSIRMILRQCLGICYLYGYGLPQKKGTEGLEIFKDLFKQVSTSSMILLNNFCIQNENDESTNTAREMILKFAFNSNWILKNFSGLDWIDNFAQGKNPYGQWILGEKHYHGFGRKKDEAAAKKYFEKALELFPNDSKDIARLRFSYYF